jgi:hypothetical protein
VPTITTTNGTLDICETPRQQLDKLGPRGYQNVTRPSGRAAWRFRYASVRETALRDVRNVAKPGMIGAGWRTRTPDLLITNQPLYRLS